MRRTLAIIAAVVVTSGLAITAPAVADQNGSKKSNNSGSLTKAVTVNGILQHQRQFQTIADRNEGTRASGLPGHTESADYVAKKLRNAGYKVTRQKFTFAFSRDLEPATLAEISPTAREIETAAFSYSGSGDVTGAVVPTNDVLIPPTAEPNGSTSGCEASDFAAAPAEPSIALVQRGTCTFAAKADNAADAGYDAVIIMNEGQPGRDGLAAGTLGDPKTIPVVGVSFADGAALYADAQAGPTTAHVFASTEADLNRETENVIADLPANKVKKNADQVVVVGAHLDSVVEGPGINDNGSGSAAILEIAEEMSELKLTKKLERPVRFAFWGAEEAGLLGSEHYVTTLSDDERANIYANLNFDMLGSPNYVRFVYDGDGSASEPAGPPGSGAIEKVFTDYFDSKDLESEPTEFSGRSDYGPFIAAGIPAGGLFSGAEGVKTPEEAVAYGGTAGAPYDSCYHQACDTITNLNTNALQELGDAAAHAVYMLTMSKVGLFGDGNSKAAKASAKQIKQFSSESVR